MLNELTCSQQYSSSLNLGKSVVIFGMGRSGGNKKYRADGGGICLKTRDGKFRIAINKSSFAHIH